MIVLNLGAGGNRAPADIVAGGQEIMVDVVPPADVIADIRQLPFDDDYADVIFSSHCIEHFDEDQIIPMLVEWRRVLKPGGFMHIECPDIQSAARLIAINGIDAALYVTPDGTPIRGQDLIFGLQSYIVNGGDPMRHKVAMDARKLTYLLNRAGFVSGNVVQRPEVFALFGRVHK